MLKVFALISIFLNKKVATNHIHYQLQKDFFSFPPRENISGKGRLAFIINNKTKMKIGLFLLGSQRLDSI